MAGSTQTRYSRGKSFGVADQGRSDSAEKSTANVVGSSALPRPLTTDSPVHLLTGAVGDFKDRRRRRRVAIASMYSCATIRMFTRPGGPLEGHVVDLSEAGIAVEIDERLPVGSAVTVEFMIAGLGRQRRDEWPTFAAAAEIVRLDNLDDFPAGPYRTALRFVRIATMVQAQIARYVVMQPAAS